MSAKVIVVVMAMAVALAACGSSASVGQASGTDPIPTATGTVTSPTMPSDTAPASPPTTVVTSTSVTPSTAAPAPSAAPTTQAALAPPATGSLAGKVVVLDPGHNEQHAAHTAEINQLVNVITGTKACDTTGTATNAGYSEARFTTDVVARAAAHLRSLGATVVVTRDASTPWGPCITERAAIGNRAHADIALSIHADGGPAGGRGFHVIRPGLVAGHNDAIIAPSAAFATVLHDTFAEQTGIPPATYIGSNGYDTRTDLGGLNLSTVPKVFIECANMRNATDAALVSDPGARERMAAAIASAVARYLGAG